MAANLPNLSNLLDLPNLQSKRWWCNNKILNPQCQSDNPQENESMILYSNFQDCTTKCETKTTNLNRDLKISRDIQKYTLAQYIDTNDILKNPSIYAQLTPIIYQNFKSVQKLLNDWRMDQKRGERNFLNPENIESTKIVLNTMLTKKYNDEYDPDKINLIKFIFRNIEFIISFDIIGEKGWLEIFRWMGYETFRSIFADIDEYGKNAVKIIDSFLMHNGKLLLSFARNFNFNSFMCYIRRDNKYFNDLTNIINIINNKRIDFIKYFLSHSSSFTDRRKIDFLTEILKDENTFNFVKNDLSLASLINLVVKAFEIIFTEKKNLMVSSLNMNKILHRPQIELLINFISKHMDAFLNKMNPQILEDIISDYITDKEKSYNYSSLIITLINSGIFQNNPKLMIILLSKIDEWFTLSLDNNSLNGDYMKKYELLFKHYRKSFENLDFQNHLLSAIEQWAHHKNLRFLAMIPWYPQQLQKIDEFLIGIFIKKNNHHAKRQSFQFQGDDNDDDSSGSEDGDDEPDEEYKYIWIRQNFPIFLNTINTFNFDNDHIWHDLLRSVDKEEYKSNRIIQRAIMKKYFIDDDPNKFARAYELLVHQQIYFPTYLLLENKDSEALKNWRTICANEKTIIESPNNEIICSKFFPELLSSNK